MAKPSLDEFDLNFDVRLEVSQTVRAKNLEEALAFGRAIEAARGEGLEKLVDVHGDLNDYRVALRSAWAHDGILTAVRD